MKFKLFSKKKKKLKIKDRISAILKSIDREVLVNRGSRSFSNYSFFNTVDNNRWINRSRRRRRK